jgi:hypothetical protein
MKLTAMPRELLAVQPIEPSEVAGGGGHQALQNPECAVGQRGISSIIFKTAALAVDRKPF